MRPAANSGEVSVAARAVGGLGRRAPVLQGLGESLTNFILGLRGHVASSRLGLALTSYTDTKCATLPPGASGGKARFDRDGPHNGTGAERRVDPSDGIAYTEQEFEEFYTHDWRVRWASAKWPTGNEDSRRLTAVLFLDGEWQPAHGGLTTVYAFDEHKSSFRALQLPPEADTLLLFRADRVLYHVAPARNAPRRSMSTHFLGHYM